jgi:hypothetical protein
MFHAAIFFPSIFRFVMTSIKNLLAVKDYFLPSLALLCVLVLVAHGPIAQDQRYHDFADQRTIWGIPHFNDVLTNLPFCVAGLLGIGAAGKIKDNKLRQICFALFAGFVLLTFGSGYYHLWPKNETLVYDRIPMTVIFMSFFSFIIYVCRGQQKGYTAFVVLNITGILSVLYWMVSEQKGSGDLRWYGMVQFFPLPAIPLLLLLYPPPVNLWKEVALIFLFFGLAKLTETFDKDIYHLLHNTLSGHSLKHLLMAVAGYEIVVLVRRWIKP